MQFLRMESKQKFVDNVLDTFFPPDRCHFSTVYSLLYEYNQLY